MHKIYAALSLVLHWR